MAYSAEVLSRAKARLAQDANKKHAEYEKHLAQAYQLRPRLREIDRALRGTGAKLAAVIFQKETDPAAEVERLRAENLALQNERQWLLDEAELPEDFLDDSPVCTLCGGTGYRGSQMCECLRELCRQEQKRELAPLFRTGKESFEHFSLNVYPDVYIPALRNSARALMRKNLSFCIKYAQSFTPAAENLLFSGSTGLGKTFLSACIARRVVDSGFSVTYTSANSLFSDYEAVRFSRREPELLAKYQDCDLLILDDLGTELVSPLVISSLYTVINERLLSQRATIISTNLTPDKLESRYEGQAASRLLGLYRVLTFEGTDIRRMALG
jgi:DNA replication protein DnaC